MEEKKSKEERFNEARILHKSLDEKLQMLQAKHGAQQLSTVVAGIPGPVDRTTGKVCSPTVVPSWVGLNPSSELRDRIPGAIVHTRMP